MDLINNYIIILILIFTENTFNNYGISGLNLFNNVDTTNIEINLISIVIENTFIIDHINDLNIFNDVNTINIDAKILYILFISIIKYYLNHKKSESK